MTVKAVPFTYRYGVILKKLDLTNEAVNVLVEAVQAEPLHWGAWLELSLLINDRDMVSFGAHTVIVVRFLKEIVAAAIVALHLYIFIGL